MSLAAMKQALDAMEYIHSPMTEEEDRRIAHAVMGLIDAIDQAEAKWIGLTPEEAKEISLANRPYVVDMVRALEQRLKEKNCG